VEDELAAWGGGVDRLLEAAEPDVAVGEPSDGVDQVTKGAAEPVQFPDDQGVAGAKLVQELLEGGPVSAGAASRLGEHPVAAGTLQGVDLELRLLVRS
jgi:ABC-type sugar transport system substrate-binding protein